MGLIAAEGRDFSSITKAQHLSNIKEEAWSISGESLGSLMCKGEVQIRN